MTEIHNGEPHRPAKAAADKPKKEPRKVTQYAAKNDAGELAVFTARPAALEWACPPGRVQEFNPGDKITL